MTILLGLPTACGGESTRNARGNTSTGGDTAGNASTGGTSSGGTSNGGTPTGGTPTGDECTPASAAPDPGPFEPPELSSLGSFELTFRNRCPEMVWPAWAHGGGLDNSVISPELWVALRPHSERTVTVYGGVRDVGLWGRTGCSFDESGNGACQSGDCGGFVCSVDDYSFSDSATVYAPFRGFTGGYNLPLRVESDACGIQECGVNLDACPSESVLRNQCDRSVACSEQLCVNGRTPCSQPSSPDASGDLVLTFCP